jgi:hypothetical protein
MNMAELPDFPEEQEVLVKYMTSRLTVHEWPVLFRMFDHGDQLRELLAELKVRAPEKWQQIADFTDAEEEALAKGNAPTNDGCQNCQYSSDSERVLCLDCDDEYGQPDDGNYDLWRGSGPCEICQAPTEGESNLCWIHLFAAMG